MGALAAGVGTAGAVFGGGVGLAGLAGGGVAVVVTEPAGLAIGAAGGAITGIAIGMTVCPGGAASSGGGSGRGGGNVRENRQANDAKTQAERETGKKFSRPQERLFHDADKRDMDYHAMVQLAKDILNGVINMP